MYKRQVQGDGRVFLRQPREYGHINGEADLGEQAEKVSDEAAIAGTGGLAAVSYTHLVPTSRCLLPKKTPGMLLK